MYKKATPIVYIQSIQLLIYIYIYLCPPSSINKIHLFSLKIGLVVLLIGYFHWPKSF